MTCVLGHFVETYRGSSFPTLVESTASERFVLKMRGAGNGGEALVAEYLVNRLAHDAGLPVPDVRIMTIRADHPWRYGTDEFHDLVRKSVGANLALTVLDSPRPLGPHDLASLPAEFVTQVVTLDLIFANCDRTHRSNNLVRDRQGKLWMLDHGACRFAFLKADEAQPKLPPGHIFAGREAECDAARFQPLTRETLARTCAEIPPEWWAATPLDREAVGACLARRLGLTGRN